MGERGVQGKGKEKSLFFDRLISHARLSLFSLDLYLKHIHTQPQSGDSDATKALGALENAAVFVVFISAVTFALVIAFKNGMSRFINAYMALSGFSIFSVLCGLISIQVIATLRLPVDAFTYALSLWNFAAVGTCALFVCRAPLTLKQCYLVAIGVATAFVFTGVPEWTTWALLGGMAAYDLWAVLSPTGPLKLLLDAAHDRGEDIPALIYEARPNRRAVAAAGGGGGVALGEQGGGRAGSRNSNNPGLPLGVVAGSAFFFSSLSSLTGTMARRGRGGGGGGGEGSRSGSGEGAAAAAEAEAPVAASLSENAPLLAEARASPPPAAAASREQEQEQRGGENNNGNAAAARSEASEEEDESFSGLPDGIKLGLGDFIFYSVLVGRASMYDGIDAISAALAVLAGLGLTLLLLAAGKKALPALPISIALGALCTAVARFALEPLVMPLASSMLFF